MVVVGLFLAFQLDRWYESQRNKSDLQAHLVSLTEDFTENEKRLTLAISEGMQEMEAAITLRTEIRKQVIEVRLNATRELARGLVVQMNCVANDGELCSIYLRGIRDYDGLPDTDRIRLSMHLHRPATAD